MNETEFRPRAWSWPTGHEIPAELVAAAELLKLLGFLLGLAACAPGGPPETLATLPDRPTVPADNPFHCPRAPAPGQPPGASR